MLYGYARVSTVQQDTALQMAAFRAAGVRRVIEETASGARERPQLERLLSRLRVGDVLVVYKLDRLARSLVDLMRIIEAVRSRGAAFRSLTEPLDTASPAGRLLLQMLGAVAEFERAVIRERCQAGRVAARERGVRFGRPPTLAREVLLKLRSQGHTWAQVAAIVGCNLKSAQHAARGLRRCDGGPGTYHRVGGA